MNSSPYSRIGEYEIIREIEHTDKSYIFLARHNHKTVERALKTSSDAMRLIREKECLERLSHPNIVNMYDSDLDAETPYIIMDYCTDTLRKRLSREGKFDVPSTLGIVKDLLSALDHAHKNGIVHCDIKPENVLIDKRVRLTDFNFSTLKLEDRLANSMTGPAGGGTYPYLSPEQKEGKEVTARTDIYQMGILLHELLTGHTPHLMGPTLAKEAGAPAWIDSLFSTSIKHLPDERFASAQAMIDYIDLNTRPLQEQLAQENRTLRLVLSRARKRSRYTALRMAAVAGSALVIGLGAGAYLGPQLSRMYGREVNGTSPIQSSTTPQTHNGD